MPSEPPHSVRPDLFLRLDPAEAASGTTKTVTLPTPEGRPRTLTIKLPPGIGPGTLLRLPGAGRINPLTGQPNDLIVRVMVTSTNKKTRHTLVGVGAFVALGLVAWLLVATLPATSASPTSSSFPPSSFDDTTASQPDSPTFDYSPSQPTMAPPTTTPEYGTGTCLSGTLPDSSVPEPVGPDVTEVPCTSPDAHYRVIQDIPGTTDLHRCDSNPQTQYEFSSEEDINGVPTDQYVYCLVGIGSYAR